MWGVRMNWLLTIGSFYAGVFFGIILAALMQAAKEGNE